MAGLNRRVVYGAQDLYLRNDFPMGGYNTLRSGGGHFYYVFYGAEDVYLISEHELLAKNTFVEISRLLRGVLKRVIKHATLKL